MSVQTMTPTGAARPVRKEVTDRNAIRPFQKINVPEAELTELRSRINATRWPDRETVTDQTQGVQLATTQALARYWATDYDWRKIKAKLNALPNFVTEIDGLDIVFANAGISGRTPTGSTDEAIFENVIRTNLSASFFTVNSAAPLLNENGSIIINGSVHNYLGQAGVAAYAATKGGVVSMARSIAADLAPRKIRVNVVAPGATKTPIWNRGSRTAEESAKMTKAITSRIPLGRWGEPEDLAKAVLFLASDDSAYISAIELMVDGGATGAPWGTPGFQE